jgi:glycyl-tRNA synthetase
VLAQQAANPYRAAQAVAQLAAWTKGDAWATTLAAYARCVRITRDQRELQRLTPEALTEPAEQALYAAYQQAAGQPVGTVDEFFAVLLPMIPAISAFFESVMVMADDPVRRANRLGLLQRLAALAAGLADFSKLEGF